MPMVLGLWLVAWRALPPGPHQASSLSLLLSFLFSFFPSLLFFLPAGSHFPLAFSLITHHTRALKIFVGSAFLEKLSPKHKQARTRMNGNSSKHVLSGSSRNVDE